ncbi:hypothetical protein [Vibrio phage vB_VibM_10AMN]|uniref:Uncharacterized protein n=1 Tax=Staphylococcus phage vB_VibM_10AMN12 TaxID=3076785 RepID=A0AA96KSI0_9CAUD|nr:hypothetical protein [Vibrio phage vB_VibM_10AMN]WNO47419.1 hypothetical protein [Staphylococcus phage vB_VibM_10AMN12]
MEINIEDYLTEEEIKDTLRQALRDKFDNYLESNWERVCNNSAYHCVWESVDEVIDGTFKQQLEDNVQKVMKNFNEFNLFRKPDAWDREPNSAYKLLMESVQNNKHLIDERVQEVIKALQPREDWNIDLDCRIGDLILTKLFNEEK